MLTDEHRDGYILQWLDILVSETFKPAGYKMLRLLPEDLEKLRKLVTKEIKKVWSAIMTIVFSLQDEGEIGCAIKKYHSSLTALLDQALEDIEGAITQRHREALHIVVSGIDGLLTLVEQRFKVFLSIDERVPATYFERVKAALLAGLKLLSGESGMQEFFDQGFNIVRGEITHFLDGARSYTFRQLYYLTDLVSELKSVPVPSDAMLFSGLDELLIRLNFNSHHYVKHLTEKLTLHINEIEPVTERMDQLMFYRKRFNQINRKPGVKFLLKETDLHRQVDNWFAQEIFYLQKNNHFASAPVKEKAARDAGTEKQKIRAKLSIDQMALILRAADDTRVIVARSLSSIFKNIAPFLSTDQKENISFDSMRSKSYSAELRDKEIAIQTLQQLIEKIKEY